MEENESLYIKIPEAANLLGVSRTVATKCVREVNQRQKAAGKWVCSGRCNRAAFMEYVGFEGSGAHGKM